jgi:hypothetical protein
MNTYAPAMVASQQCTAVFFLASRLAARQWQPSTEGIHSRLELFFVLLSLHYPHIRVQQWSAGYGFVSMVPDEAGITLSGMATAGMNSAGISCDEQTLVGSKCVYLPSFF